MIQPLYLQLLLLLFAIFLKCMAGYTPTENFAISCGDSGDLTDQQGRNWTGDIGSEFSPSENGYLSKTCYPSEQQPVTAADPVPYTRARLSRKEFTYSFPVRPGQKYIRLHFYPSSYCYVEFNRSSAFFAVSVKASGMLYTLLRNFSAALAVDASPDQKTFAKEFHLIVMEGEEYLNITFRPTAGADSYAFINGIEVVSMPDYLYYTPPLTGGFKFMGQSGSFSFLDTDYPLEKLYRLNVGGRSISPNNDTGMYRTWDGDDIYLVEPRFVPAINTSINLKFTTKLPNYTAPEEVYQTARSMGNNKTQNMGYNLTWVLPVDPGFSYIVRLHFCEFQPEIQNEGDRVFMILIGNRTAEEQADIIAWSGGNGVPICRDYGITMPISQGNSSKKQGLYIQLHPNRDDRTIYNDAILNGIEVFKLIGRPVRPAASASRMKRNKKNNKKLVGTAVGVAIAILVLCSFAVHWMKRNRASGRLRDRGRSSPTLDPICCHFSLQEIKMATKNFDKGYIIGEGGFGNVYKGFINGGATPVAVKRLNPDSQQGVNEFMTEIEMLSQLRYLHLVSLIGYCNRKREMILIYDYMANGNLRDHLYNTENPPLPWTQRLQICIGAARGLHYLHAGLKKTIIHRDVKTTNILLDHKWVAKVADFGLSKMSPTSVANAHISTVVKGSFGYLDPEYFRFQRLNEKSDVYSFGVVLLEVLCARPPVNPTGEEEEEQAGLAYWAVNNYKNGNLEEIVDPHLKGEIAPLCLEKYAEIAASCVLDQRIHRPSMADVVKGLELALELQEESEKGRIVNKSLDHEHDQDTPSEISTSTSDDEMRIVTDSQVSRMTGKENFQCFKTKEDNACIPYSSL